MIDCTNFRFPRPKYFNIDKASPTYVRAYVDTKMHGIKLSVKIQMWLMEKNDSWGKSFPQCSNWLFSHDDKNVDFVHLTIDNHTAWLGSSVYRSPFGDDESEPEERILEKAAVDLDEDHYWAFQAEYYIKKIELNSENGAKAVAEIREYLQNIVKSVQFSGGYAHAIRQKNAPEGKPVQDAKYPSVAQQTDDPFHARHYPEYFQHLQETLAKRYELLPYEEGICANARLTIGFKACAEDDYSQKGNTRFFGLPDLPPDVEYPKHDPKNEEKKGNYWKFIAQINFSELKGMCDYLPERGILYFFIESQYNELVHVEGNRFEKSLYRHKVFYYDGDSNELISAKDLDIEPEYIIDVDAGYEREDGAQPARMEIFPCVQIMNYEDFENYQNGKKKCPIYPPLIVDEEQFVPIRQFNYALLGDKNFFHSAINGSVQDLYHGSPYTQAANTLGGKPEDYVLLLQAGGDSTYSGYDFGDADTLYFVIHKEKLKKLDFSEVYCTMTWWWAEFGGDDE